MKPATVPQSLRANLTNDEFAQLIAEASALRAENQRLREALEFFAANYANTDYPSDQIAQEKARAALNPRE